MSLREKLHEIMKKKIEFNELIKKVEDVLKEEKEEGNIKEYEYVSDKDVYNSCCLDIYYLSICWIDNDNKLQIIGSSYYSE